MESETEFLESIGGLPSVEKAAAIAHRIYVLTAERTGWPIRGARQWSQLEKKERAYNMESVQTWAAEERLFRLFLEAIEEERPDHSS